MKRKPEDTQIKIHNTCKLMHRQKDGQKDGSEQRRTNEERGSQKVHFPFPTPKCIPQHLVDRDRQKKLHPK